jgi:hypothetical protein
VAEYLFSNVCTDIREQSHANPSRRLVDRGHYPYIIPTVNSIRQIIA